VNKLITAGAIVLITSFVLAAELFQPYGFWGSVHTTGDENTEYHANGFELELYRHKNDFVGYLHEFVNEPYDPPMGRLDNLKVNEKTGDISFETKMSLYCEAPNYSIRNSKNLYRFRGRIGEEEVVGVMESLNPESKEVESKKEIVLGGRKGGVLHKGEETYESWRSYKENFMKTRGPKW
jgi:hypothetical protein